MRRSRWTILLAVLAGIQFCTLLGRTDINASHEGRVAQTAREMLESRDWLVPHLAGKPRLQKPPLPYWCAAGLWKISAPLDVALARLVPAALGAVATLIMIDLGRRFFGRAGGILCGLVWLSTWFIVDEFRKAMADPYLAFFTLLAVWSWIRADRASPSPRTQGEGRGEGSSSFESEISNVKSKCTLSPPLSLNTGRGSKTAFILVSWIALALGVLAKGPFILLHVAIAIIAYHIVLRRRARWSMAHLIGFALFLAIAAPWPILIYVKVPHVADVWMRESMGEAAGARNAQPFWYYLRSLPQTTAPWTAIALIGFIWPFMRTSRRDRMLCWPLIWLGATIVIFSISPQKKNAYLLSAMPAQTMLIAGTLALAVRQNRSSQPTRIVIAAHAIGVAVAVIVVYALVWKGGLSSPRVDLRAGLVAAIGLVVAIWAVRLSLAKPQAARATFMTAIAFAAAIYGVVGWLRPDHENRRSPKPFVIAMNAAVGDARVASVGFISEDVLFYIRRPIEILDDVVDLPGDFTGFVLVADENLESLRSARPASVLVVTMPNRRASDRTFLVSVAPAMAQGAAAR